MWIMIKSSITLVIIALITIILILALVCVLVSLTPAMEILASKGTSCILASIGSMASGLTSIILIMVIVISILLITVLIVLCLWWWIFWFLLRFLPLLPPLGLGCLGRVPLKGWGISVSSLSFEWAICEYKPGTAVPLANVDNAAAGGSHFLIICSNSLAFLVVAAQSFSVIRCICIMVGIVSINLSFLDSSFWPSISPKVSIKSICSSMSIF